MKICMISPTFPPKRCGIGDYTYFLARALSEMGDEVVVLTSQWHGDKQVGRELHADSGLQVLRIVKGWGLSALPGLFRLVKEVRPDVIHIQYCPHLYNPRGLTLMINLLAICLRVGSHSKLVTTFHELYIPCSWSFKKLVGGVWQRLMAVLIAMASHRIIVTCELWERRLRRLAPKKALVIPVGSNIPVVSLSEEERLSIRRQLASDDHSILFGTFGTLHESKDYRLVLEVMARLATENDKVRLIWMGDTGSGKTSLSGVQGRAIALGLEAKNVVFTGYRPPEEVSRLLQACDIFVLPLKDGISTRRTTLITALAHGLPVVGTYGESTDSMFVHRENMFLVEVGDADGFVNALHALISDPLLRANVAAGGRELYRRCFKWSEIARATKTVYAS